MKLARLNSHAERRSSHDNCKIFSMDFWVDLREHFLGPSQSRFFNLKADFLFSLNCKIFSMDFWVDLREHFLGPSQSRFFNLKADFLFSLIWRMCRIWWRDYFVKKLWCYIGGWEKEVGVSQTGRCRETEMVTFRSLQSWTKMLWKMDFTMSSFKIKL